ncbi:hypothetical protein SS50377_27815 [Spironucleus salmonicida]|uniref:Uncharacterized protein n=1 Tax=Spironucleus salmonicida TaxID=348837 RepID=V6LYR0_9EUKA|nr:hypothetical protein SS50377_27815 [Spironucleus salmonicida]|eukprot:EST48866.1 hypothetical protein SS50377_10967 [Spironucleus salmonicida]
MQCPICNAKLSNNLLENDILSQHWRQGQCNYSQFTLETLDLYQFFVTDVLLLINTIIKLPKVKHIFISLPQSKKTSNLTYIRSSSSYQDFLNSSFFDNVLQKFGFTSTSSQDIPFLKLTSIQCLLQIPFEEINRQNLAIQLNGKTQLIDINEVLQDSKIYLDKEIQMKRLMQTPISPSRSPQLIETVESKSAGTSLTSFLKGILISKPNTPELNEFFHNLPQAVKRRNQVIFLNHNLQMLVSCLLPSIETLDGQKLPLRKEAAKFCMKRYSFPHKNMFPIQVSKKQVNLVSNFLQNIGFQNIQYQQKLILGNTLDYCLLRSAIISKQSVQYPFKLNNFNFQYDILKTQKAMIMDSIQNPRILSLTNQSSINNTGNFQLNYDNLEQEYGQYVSIDVYNDIVYIGTQKGYIIELNCLVSYVEQSNIIVQKFADYEINNLQIIDQKRWYSTQNKILCEKELVTEIKPQIQNISNSLLITEKGIYKNEQLVYPNAISATSTQLFDITSNYDGYIQFYTGSNLIHEQKVSDNPIIKLFINKQILVAVDVFGCIFSINIITKQIIGQYMVKIKCFCDIQISFFGRRIIACQESKICIFEVDFRLFREIFIEKKIIKIKDIDEGSFCMILQGADQAREVVVVDLMRE